MDSRGWGVEPTEPGGGEWGPQHGDIAQSWGRISLHTFNPQPSNPACSRGRVTVRPPSPRCRIPSHQSHLTRSPIIRAEVRETGESDGWGDLDEPTFVQIAVLHDFHAPPTAPKVDPFLGSHSTAACHPVRRPRAMRGCLTVSPEVKIWRRRAPRGSQGKRMRRQSETSQTPTSPAGRINVGSMNHHW